MRTTVGGLAAYWQSYGYDLTGNRTQLVQHDPSGNTLQDTAVTQTFPTPGTLNTPTTAQNTGGGTGGPHALLGATTTAPSGPSSGSMQYDAAGNTTSITDPTGTATLTWDGEDKLTSYSKTSGAGATTYTYDASGNQLVRRDPGKTTITLGNDELVYDSNAKTLTGVRYYTIPGGITLVRQGGTSTFQIANPHGTNTLALDGTTLAESRRPTDPFGNPRGNQPSTWAGDKGFVGGTQDQATGFTNLGAREYQPSTGRFLSTDPLLNPADPQQWNGYAYSNNSPVNSSDPTGKLSNVQGGGCGTGCDVNAVLNDPNYYPNVPEPQILAPDGFGKYAQTAPSSSGKNKKSDNGGAGNFKDFLFGVGTIPWSFGAAIHKVLWVGDSQDDPIPHPMDSYYNWAQRNGVDTDSANFASGSFLFAALGDSYATSGDDPAAISSGGCNSFLPGTPVLLANGATKAIDKLAGDQVAATDPQTGLTTAQPITQYIVTPGDQDFTDLTLLITPKLAASSTPPRITTIASTQHHPYWDLTTQRWTDAADLHQGDQLLAADGSTVVVQAIRNYQTPPTTTYNLTVDQVHTYYVLAGATPVLVHNCGGNDAPFLNDRNGQYNLQSELGRADSLGVKPVRPGQPGFDEAINSGDIKWVVGSDGKLVVMPKTVAGEEIPHSVLTRGQPVLAAGEADVAGGDGFHFGLRISNNSGHYMPCNCSLDIGIQNFREAGIEFDPGSVERVAP
ncbi:RHS repeat-associated protein [Kitasatospora sp. GAS204A]|uniref:polymorphic toxin-type HINT domain-containing protein n=1 Tax=unclassified Kitasatospora TaxID=2633591 RepID=UPI002473539E|nr:polymorphic toxin-type HINT domain-containing protein [Kitasatospora sp. GAS204B]MDH6117300.1 RHS repeat-associated protein [Kitasatospora sp. GAS204B]